MTQAELDSLVAQIGEEILARARKLEAVPGKKGEGLNLPDQVCPGCQQRCPQTCARNTKEIIAAGADRVSASERLTKIDPGDRRADRSHHSQGRRHPRRYRQGLPRGAPVQLRQRLRESVLGAAGALGTCRLAGEGLHRGRLPAGRHQHRSQGRRSADGRCAPARRRDRHGDQRRRAEIGRSRCGARAISKAWCASRIKAAPS